MNVGWGTFSFQISAFQKKLHSSVGTCIHKACIAHVTGLESYTTMEREFRNLYNTEDILHMGIIWITVTGRWDPNILFPYALNLILAMRFGLAKWDVCKCARDEVWGKHEHLNLPFVWFSKYSPCKMATRPIVAVVPVNSQILDWSHLEWNRPQAR